MTDAAGSSGSVLTIDLDALAANWRRLAAEAQDAECAAVVKADAYGLGIAQAAPALWRAGARTFFVAHLDEGIAVRRVLPEARVVVLNGAQPGAEPEFAAHDLMPCLNHLGAVYAWAAFCAEAAPHPAVLHLDTGMSRLGLPPDEVDILAHDPGRLEPIPLALAMSHLSRAEERDPMNAAQRSEFGRTLAKLPRMPASLCNSAGIFLGPDYHFEMVRPGSALYGVNPTPGRANPMRDVVRLDGMILQVRTIDTPRAVGYGATFQATRPTKIATVAVGYADGYLRSLGNRGSGYIGDVRVPVVGRVSMDLITLDVTRAPEALAQPGRTVELLGPRHGVDALGEEAGTIGYEILTSLGRRYHRRYFGEGG